MARLASRPTPPAAARRDPHLRVNWVAFLGTGAALGFLAGVLFHLFGPAAAGYGMRTTVLFLGAFCAMLGGLLGGLVGVLADAVLARRSDRSARPV